MNSNTILIVDDMEVNRAILRAVFEREYNLLEAENGEQAVMLLKQYQNTIAAVLLDLVMPVKDGYKVLEEMQESHLLNKIPVIVVTAQETSESEVRAFDLGASDIIIKPFEPHVVSRRVQNTVELNRYKRHLEELVEEQSVNLRESKEALMDALSSVIEHRSIESGQHVLRIRMFTKLLLEDVMRSYPEYNLDERRVNLIASAAALHDIGKIAIPDAILNKPGPLTPEEFDTMKTHAVKGCEILASLDRMHDKEYLRYGYNICRFHHERWDGRGYPDGLSGDSIPICAQVVGIADAYDALTSDRVYKKAIAPKKACNMILNGECGSFAPELLESFKNVRAQFAVLSGKYADGHSPKADSAKLAEYSLTQNKDVPNTLERGQQKYFAMLRFADSTVLEVDIDSGVYHLVYQQNDDFEALRSGYNFEQLMKMFAEKAVHPDDRKSALEILDKNFVGFFDSGIMKRSWQYRILHRASGEYVRYEASVLKLSLDDLEQRKVLLAWRAIDRVQNTTQTGGDLSSISFMMQSLLIGVLQCANDRSFTIRNVNEGFVTLFGYSNDEIKDRFDSRYIEMIYSDDRPRVWRQVREQLNRGTSAELEYRVNTREGQLLWVLEKCQLSVGEDGQENLSCVLIDITQSKQEQEKLRLTMERHQIIMNQTNDIIFEWDIEKNAIYYSNNWVKKFGYTPISDDISLRIPQTSHIMPDDVPSFLSLMQQVVAGQPYGEVEIRIANAEGRYMWFRIRATTQFDGSGKPVKAVGVILDIDTEKRRAQDLIEKAERDTLTHLYNKNAARRRIEHLLERREPEQTAAMLIIDIDNFKLVNDSHGHMFGDAMLVEIASRIKKLFRTEDIITRIGGDEFLVYATSLADPSNIGYRAAKVIEAVQGAFADDLQGFKLSCSIGVSFCPQDGSSFQDLFQRCDQALYFAKAQGKSRFIMFDKATMSKTFGLNPQQMVASTRIDSDEIACFDNSSIVQQAFKELYEAGDVEEAVKSILEMVGHKFNVSRAYIFENSEDDTGCKNTFEWCNEGITPEKDMLQNILYVEDLGGHYYDNFNENGIFYCSDIAQLPKEQYDILAPQGILSLLQCAVRNNGKFVGYVGFDDCTVQRIWSQNQIDALTFISELISTFLLKKRAQDRALATADGLRMILDNQNSWIYVIDPDTFALQYINAKTYAIAPESKVGMLCYEAFFNRTAPCEVCPARDIRSKVNRTLEIYNPVLKVWSMADASFVRWGNRDACLLSCHDITPYKTVEAEVNIQE